MRITRWTESGYENGRIAARIGFPFKVPDLVRIVDPIGWQEAAKAGRGDGLAPWAYRWSRSDFYQLALYLHQRSLESIPPLDRYPELRGMDQYLADYVRGLADESGCSYEEAVWSQQYRPVSHYVQTLAQPEPILPGVPAGCTTVVFARTDRGPIIGRNTDDGIQWGDKVPRCGEPHLNVMPPERGYSYIEGIDDRRNEKGLSIHGSSIAYPLEPDSTEYFPVDIQEMVVQHCATVAEAVDLVRRYSTFGGATNVVVVDAQGNAAAIEKGKAQCAVRWMDKRSVVFCTSGVAVEPATKRFMDIEGSSYQWNLARYRRIDALVADGPLTVEHMWNVMTDHHPTDFICKHFDKQAPGALGNLRQFLTLPAESRHFARQYDPATGRHPCAFSPDEHLWSFTPLQRELADVWS